MARKLLAVLLVLGVVGPRLAAQDTLRRDGWVVLPADEYRALRTRAYPPDPVPDPPPVEAALTRVDYDLRVAGDAAIGEARLTIDVLKDGWVRVLVPSGLRVREARVDGRPVALVEGTPGTKGPYVLLSKPGRTTLTLDVAVPVAAAAGQESLSLAASGAAVTRAVLVVPRAGVDLVTGGGTSIERGEANNESRFVVHGQSGEALILSWRRKREDRRASQPLRLRGSVVQLVGLGEDGAQVTAEVSLEPVQGAAASVALALPDGLVVNQVNGAVVADWEFKPGSLSVTFLEPLETTTRFVVVGEAKTGREGKLEVPLLRLGQAERETGGVAVEVLGAGEIKAHEARGLDPGDASDLAGPVAGKDSPSLVAFRFRPQEGRAARGLVVEVARYTPQAVLVANVEEARYQVLVTEDGKLLVRASYAVRNNQRSLLLASLPPGATLWSAAVGGRPVRPGRSAEGALLLPLEKGRAGEEAPAFAVELVYLARSPAWDKQGRASLALPTLDLQVSRTGLVLHHPPRYRVSAEPGEFRIAAYEPPASDALRQPAARPAAPPPPPAPRTFTDKKETDEAKRLDEVQSLVERFQKAGHGSRAAGVLPVQVPFPAFGPSVFLVSELTAEAQAPALGIAYRRSEKGGR